ncbi:hypothetical protein R1sor_001819 [Riccia sorocarpa]|uniref:Uncharacterized protein n=1 Tax=Riccia sorocarpa TaxID=122646 RepID=A0ABD3H060_9MARC
MDVLDSQTAVPPTLEAATVEVLVEDIPVAAIQAPMTSVVVEVTMGENLVDVGASIVAEMTMGENLGDVGGASEPTYDHEVEKGQSIPEVVPTTSKATTVEVRIADIPVAAVQAPPTSVVAEVTMVANLDKVVLDVSDYLPIVSPDVTHWNLAGLANDREMLKVLNNFCETVPLEQDLQTSAPLVERDTQESSTRVPDPTMPSGPQSEADLEAIGRGNVVESVVAAKDDTEQGLPMNVAIGVPT